MDAGGFAPVSAFTEHQLMKSVSAHQLWDIVARDDRFEMLRVNKTTYIRTTYGHTVSLEGYHRESLTCKKLPKILVHATTQDKLPNLNIKEQGETYTSDTH